MQELISIQRSTRKLHMFMSMDMVLDSGRQAVDDLVKIVRETLADSEQFLELKPERPQQRARPQESLGAGKENSDRSKKGVVGMYFVPQYVVAWSRDRAKLGTSVVAGLALGVAHSL